MSIGGSKLQNAEHARLEYIYLETTGKWLYTIIRVTATAISVKC